MMMMGGQVSLCVTCDSWPEMQISMELYGGARLQDVAIEAA